MRSQPLTVRVPTTCVVPTGAASIGWAAATAYCSIWTGV
jgi:hypothetical protein